LAQNNPLANIPIQVLNEVSVSLSSIFQSFFVLLFSIIQWEELWLQEHLHSTSRPILTGELVLTTIETKVAELIPLVQALASTTYFRSYILSRSPFKDRLNDPTRFISPGPLGKRPPFDRAILELFDVKTWPHIASYTTTLKKLQNLFTATITPDPLSNTLMAQAKALTMAFTANDSEPCFLVDQPHPLLIGADIGICATERYRVHKKTIFHFVVDCVAFEAQFEAQNGPKTLQNPNSSGSNTSIVVSPNQTTTSTSKSLSPSPRFTSTLQLLKDRPTVLQKIPPLIALSFDPRLLSVILLTIERRFEDRESQRQWKHALHSLILLDILLEAGPEFVLTRMTKSLRGHLDEFIRYQHKEQNIQKMVRNQALRLKEHLTTRWALTGTRVYREAILPLFFRVVEDSIIPHLDQVHSLTKYKPLMISSPLGYNYPVPLLWVNNLKEEFLALFLVNKNKQLQLEQDLKDGIVTKPPSGETIWADLRNAQLLYGPNNGFDQDKDAKSEPFSFSTVFEATIIKPLQYAKQSALNSSNGIICGSSSGNNNPVSFLSSKPQHFSLIPQFAALSFMFDDSQHDFDSVPTPISQQYIDSMAGPGGYAMKNSSTRLQPIYITQQPPMGCPFDNDCSSSSLRGSTDNYGSVCSSESKQEDEGPINTDPIVSFYVATLPTYDTPSSLDVIDEGGNIKSITPIKKPGKLIANSPFTNFDNNPNKTGLKFGDTLSHLAQTNPLQTPTKGTQLTTKIPVTPSAGQSKYILRSPMVSPQYQSGRDTYTAQGEFQELQSSQISSQDGKTRGQESIVSSLSNLSQLTTQHHTPSIVLFNYEDNQLLFDYLRQDIDITTYLDDFNELNDDNFAIQNSIINDFNAKSVPSNSEIPTLSDQMAPNPLLSTPTKPSNHANKPSKPPLTPLSSNKTSIHIPTPRIDREADQIVYQLPNLPQPLGPVPIRIPPEQALSYINVQMNAGCASWQSPLPQTVNLGVQTPGIGPEKGSLSPFQTIVPRNIGKSKEKGVGKIQQGGGHLVPVTPLIGDGNGQYNNNSRIQQNFNGGDIGPDGINTHNNEHQTAFEDEAIFTKSLVSNLYQLQKTVSTRSQTIILTHTHHDSEIPPPPPSDNNDDSNDDLIEALPTSSTLSTLNHPQKPTYKSPLVVSTSPATKTVMKPEQEFIQMTYVEEDPLIDIDFYRNDRYGSSTISDPLLYTLPDTDPNPPPPQADISIVSTHSIVVETLDEWDVPEFTRDRSIRANPRIPGNSASNLMSTRGNLMSPALTQPGKPLSSHTEAIQEE
jgi:hypothetical protein